MNLDRLGDLIADLEDRIESIHRTLKDYGDSFPSDLPDLRVIHFDEVIPVEQDLALPDSSSGRQQFQQ